MTRRAKLILRTYAITTKNRVFGSENVQKKAKKYFVVILVQNDSSSISDLVMAISKQL